MARKDRTGNRKTREQRKQFKVPELGYYLIVTDTEATERKDIEVGMYGKLCKGYRGMWYEIIKKWKIE